MAEDFPSSPPGLLARGAIVELYGESVLAARYWTECLALDPDFAAAREQLALVALKRGAFEEAAQHLEICDARPELPEAGLHLGKALLSLGRYADAIAVLERQTADQPSVPEGWFRLGQGHLQARDFERARQCYAAAIELDQDCLPAWFGMAEACERLGAAEQARASRARFQQLDERHSQWDRARRLKLDRANDVVLSKAFEISADVYARHGRLAPAQAQWRRAIELNAASIYSHRALGQSLAREQRAAEALTVYRALERLEPQSADHLLSQALLHQQLQQVSEAEATLERALKLSPENARVLAALARVHATRSTGLVEAQRLAERAVRLDPTAENYAFLGGILWENQDRAGARAALREALRRDPRNSRYAAAAQFMEQE